MEEQRELFNSFIRKKYIEDGGIKKSKALSKEVAGKIINSSMFNVRMAHVIVVCFR